MQISHIPPDEYNSYNWLKMLVICFFTPIIFNEGLCPLKVSQKRYPLQIRPLLFDCVVNCG